MSKHSLVICYNALENRFFEVNAIHKVEHLYRLNFYRLSLRLNFYEGDIDMSHIDEMRELCFRKITKLMTIHNMWQNHHSFYVIDYEIRTIVRNEMDQQNNNESDRREDESENSSYDNDSAYTTSPTSGATTTRSTNNSSISSAYSSS